MTGIPICWNASISSPFLPSSVCSLRQAGAGGGKYVMRDLMRVLEQEKHAYTDPVTEVSIGALPHFTKKTR